jgi:hydroxymethylglutaryl-CoA synthase
MPVQAMSFLYVRGLARGDHHQDELLALCNEAQVSVQDVLRETQSRPDLYQRVVSGEAEDPYAATSKVASIVRKRPSFRELLAEKMSLGASAVQDLGNLYSAALPAWMAAAFEEAVNTGRKLEQAPMVAVGYGSGDAAEALPFHPVVGWEAAARRIGVTKALQGAVDLSQAQYEALHDGREMPDFEYSPKQEFRITHVGTQYDPGFQDLGIEYYEYVP